MTQFIPWWAKIALKIVWSRLPIPYGLWKRVGVFRHGFMERPQYVRSVFMTHWDRADFARKQGPFWGMELGCGDSLASSLMANAFGAARYYLVDAGKFATDDIATYRRIASALAADGVPVADISACASVPDLLTRMRAQYCTAGLQSLKAIPDQSVDFIWSQAVFEHIGAAEFAETMRELRRVLRPDGVMSHRVDLRDHLSNALNNLRFTEGMWESPLMAKSGFYTNRIRHGAMLDCMRSAGFHVDVVRADRWPQVPTPKRKLAQAFRDVPDDDLMVSGFDVVLRPR